MANSTGKIVIFTLFMIGLLITGATALKVYNTHIDNLYKVIEKKLTENATSCFQEGICEGNTTTIGFLITNGYITSQIDPLTKEYISEDTVITCIDSCSVDIRNK